LVGAVDRRRGERRTNVWRAITSLAQWANRPRTARRGCADRTITKGKRAINEQRWAELRAKKDAEKAEREAVAAAVKRRKR
jgi:hypothetical protein